MWTVRAIGDEQLNRWHAGGLPGGERPLLLVQLKIRILQSDTGLAVGSWGCLGCQWVWWWHQWWGKTFRQLRQRSVVG